MKSFTIFCLILINNLKFIHNQETTTVTGADILPLVANISVDSYYEENNFNNLIRLNISWIKFDDSNINETKIIICSKDKSGDCAHFFEKLNYPLDNRYVVCPDPFVFTPEIEFKPGCIYNIELESEQDLSRKNSVTYQIPECVGEYCDCSKFEPTSRIIDISSINDGEFLIKWDPGSLSKGNQTYNIVDVGYLLHGKNSVATYVKVDVVENNLMENYSIIRADKLQKGEDYILAGFFINNFQCKSKFWKEFSVIGNDYYVEIICIVLFIVIVIGFKYKQIGKYAGKLISILPSRYNQFVGNEPVTIPLSQVDPSQAHIPMQINVQYTPIEFMISDYDSYEFPVNKLQIKKTLGSGAFGKVFLAKAFAIDGPNTSTMVAVKTFTETSSKEVVDDFLAEIEIFKKIQEYPQHPNIVKLLGCCTITKQLMMIMEYVPCGDLKQYLIDLREQWLKKKSTRIFFPENSDGSYIVPETPTTPISITSSNLPPTPQTNVTNLETPLVPERNHLEKLLDPVELQSFALQIAKGMAHLESIPIVHRDLAARNILINQQKLLKISDFGLSRHGPYVNYKLKKRLPLRWMSIEAIIEQRYTNKSDVWSFGVVLWEIGTLGAVPYEKIIDNFLINYLQMGKRLERPEVCTNELYDLMLKCWANRPDDRPSFDELVRILDNKKKIYIDFCQLNPTYVFPPSQIVEND